MTHAWRLWLVLLRLILDVLVGVFRIFPLIDKNEAEWSGKATIVGSRIEDGQLAVRTSTEVSDSPAGEVLCRVVSGNQSSAKPITAWLSLS